MTPIVVDEIDDNIAANTGCTIPDAKNYDVAAKADDGSCAVDIVEGMTFFTQFLSNVPRLASLEHRVGGVLHMDVSDFKAAATVVTDYADFTYEIIYSELKLLHKH